MGIILSLNDTHFHHIDHLVNNATQFMLVSEKTI